MVTLDDFLRLMGDIRHDLGAPLKHVRTFAEFILEDYSPSADLVDLLRRKRDSAQDVSSLLSELKYLKELNQEILDYFPDHVNGEFTSRFCDDILPKYQQLGDIFGLKTRGESPELSFPAGTEYFSQFNDLLREHLSDIEDVLGEIVNNASTAIETVTDDSNGIKSLWQSKLDAAKSFLGITQRLSKLQQLHDIIVEPLPEHDSFGDDGLIQGIQMAQRIYAQLAFSTFNLGEGTEFFDTYHHFRLWESTLGNAGIKFDSGAYPQKDLRTTVYYDRTISNLLGNVVTHAATDCDTVYIRTFEECVDNQEYLVLAIENNGSRTLDPQEVYEKALNFNLVDPEKELTDEEKLQLIFERGYSTTHGEAVDYGEGSGKGLNIARRLAIQHGGKLVVKSPIDKDKSVGFYLYIPKDKIISE